MRDNMITKRHRSAVDGGTSRSTSRSLTMDAAVSGLFAALIAIGAFMKIVIPVGVP